MTPSLQELAALQCQPLRGPAHRLSEAAIAARLAVLPGWTLEHGQIGKRFEFANYHQTMAFVNAVANIAHEQDHHPDMLVSYGACSVRLNTHDVDGISENDFICAAKIECSR